MSFSAFINLLPALPVSSLNLSRQEEKYNLKTMIERLICLFPGRRGAILLEVVAVDRKFGTYR